MERLYLNIIYIEDPWVHNQKLWIILYPDEWNYYKGPTIIIIITIDLYCAAKCRSKLRGAGHCTSARHVTSILRHVAEVFPSAKQGTIINSHRVIGIATNTSVVVNCAYSDLHSDDSRCRTAGGRLTSYKNLPRTVNKTSRKKVSPSKKSHRGF